MQSSAGVIDYDYLIRQIQRNLPTLPIIVNELTNILEDPDTSTQAVEEVMVSDQAICTRILRIANTNMFRGNRAKVTCANEAIGTIGFDKIKDVILTTTVFKAFSSKEKAEQKFPWRVFGSTVWVLPQPVVQLPSTLASHGMKRPIPAGWFTT